MRKSQLLICLSVVFHAANLQATPPEWWEDPSTQIVEEGVTADNYAPANLGQLKNVAKKAKIYLNSNLTGGAGTAIAGLVDGFEPRAGQGYTQPQIDAFIAENYAPINLGQLKAVAKPFYDRLLASGYDTKANLIARGYPPTWAYDYPWDPTTPVAENYAPANLGQLKIVFSFDLEAFVDLTLDNNGNGIADIWERDNFSGTVAVDGDPDGDGIANLTEYLLGSDPNVKSGEIGVEFVETGLRVFTPLQ